MLRKVLDSVTAYNNRHDIGHQRQMYYIDETTGCVAILGLNNVKSTVYGQRCPDYCVRF